MVAAIGAAAAVGGSLISANAAGDAADQQSASSAQATQAQMMAAAQMRQDLSPWTEAGGAAQSRLNQYLGIGGVGSSGVTSMGLGTGLSPTQVREQLLGRFTRSNPAQAQTPTNQPSASALANMNPLQRAAWENVQQNGQGEVPLGASSQFYGDGNGPGYWGNEVGTSGQREWVSTNGQQQGGPTSTIDEEGLNAAMQQYYAEQEAQNAQAASDPNYGSLLRAYRGGAEFDSGPAYDRGADFSFTGKDLASEPGYQFGLNQGTQGIERGQASRGNFLSGSAMKELTRFNEDYAGTKFNDGFNRSLNTYNTNQTGNLNEYNTNLTRRQNEWNTNLGAYNQNRNTIYNFLTGVSNTGQASAARVGSNNQQVANSVGNNLMGAANVQGAAGIAGANALSSGINQAANAYNSTNNLNSAAGWNSLISQGGSPYGGSSTSVGGSTGWVPSTNYFASGNGGL